MSFLDDFKNTPDDKKLDYVITAMHANPLSALAELRAKQPILPVPSPKPTVLPNFVLVALRRDVQDALNHNTVFTVAPYRSKMDPVVGPFMLDHDDTVYNQRDKGIMRALIQQTDMVEVREQVAKLAKEAINKGVDSEEHLDITAHVTRNVPVHLTGDYFGFPGPDMTSMLRWSRATQTDMFYNITNDPNIHAASVAAGQEMKAYLDAYLPKQLEAVGNATAVDSIVTRLLQLVTPKGIGFDMSRIMTNTMGLLVGGVETTSAAITQATYVLLDPKHPERLAGALQAAKEGNDTLFDSYVWEALRFFPQAPFVGRLVASDYVVGAGTTHATEVKAGTLALLSQASAMMDETIEPDAGEFRPDRPSWWYMHLGYGPHRCLGDQVSQQQVPETIKQILLAGFTQRAAGAAGQVDFKKEPFPESFTLIKGDK